MNKSLCLRLWLVCVSLISAGLNTSVSAQQNTTIVILMTEKVRDFGTGFEQPGQADATLAAHFRALGYRVVDPQTVRDNLTRQTTELLLAGDQKAARVVALQHDADYSIMGTATSRPAGGELFNTQMKSIQATLTARVIRSNDSRVIASGSTSAAKVHIDALQGGSLAIQAAALALAEQLATQLAQAHALGSSASELDHVLNISGVVSYQHLNYILEFLGSDITGISTVDLRQYSNGSAEIVLRGDVASNDIALRIAKHKFKSFKLEPNKVSPGRIDIIVKMKQ